MMECEVVETTETLTDSPPEPETQAGKHWEPAAEAGEPTEPAVEAEGQPATEPRVVTLRVDLLVTLAFGLMVGIVIGYLGRPLIESEARAPAAPVVAARVESSAPTDAEAASSSADSGSSQTLLDSVIAATRHYKGDPDAPVTIIEFGDFQ